LTNKSEFQRRRQLTVEHVAGSRANALLTTALSNVRYLSNFTGSNGALLLSEERAVLFTDPRYETQAPLESDCDVRISKGPLLKEVATWIKRLKLKSVGFEQNRISFESHTQLREQLSGVRLLPLIGIVEKLRTVKSLEESELIRRSVLLNSKALDQALKRFKASMTETDLAAEIEYRMRRLGADAPAFETIVASGERAALPHARPTSQKIKANQLLLIDMGAAVAGYTSDMTRTYAVGKLDLRQRRLYQAVLESQLAAIAAIKPGVLCANVDGAARNVLRGYGLDKKFVHSTGHGLGIEIHEAPRVGRKEKTKLETGMVITIEPGAYEPELGGVRIEDTVLVTNQGCEILTPTGKELVVL